MTTTDGRPSDVMRPTPSSALRRLDVYALRVAYNGFIARHEVAWELGMAGLAILYLAIGLVEDASTEPVGGWLRGLETSITVAFLLEFGSRLLSAFDRGAYLRGHWIDIVALVPTIHEFRALRLLRFLRLVRAVAALYRVLGVPVLVRVFWHLRRVKDHFDARTTGVLGAVIVGLVLAAGLAVTWIEGPLTFQQFGESIYWAINTLLGSGDPTFVSTLPGRVISGFLIVTSLTFLAVVTGLVIGFIIDVVLKEGQGMGVAGLRDHVVVCGWTETAEEVLAELAADELDQPVVLLAPLERNPAGSKAHFVRGDPTDEADLERAGIRDAASAIVFPQPGDSDPDMHTVLIVMAIKELAPHVRVVVEAANPKNVPHLRRARADEVIATPQFVAHLVARSSVHAGLGDIVMDMVSGGEGSELYRIRLPEKLVGVRANDAGPILRADHQAVLVAVIRDGRNVVNPPADFVLEDDDEIVILAESLASFHARAPATGATEAR